MQKLISFFNQCESRCITFILLFSISCLEFCIAPESTVKSSEVWVRLNFGVLYPNKFFEEIKPKLADNRTK
jgi:hypothetical protein